MHWDLGACGSAARAELCPCEISVQLRYRRRRARCVRDGYRLPHGTSFAYTPRAACD